MAASSYQLDNWVSRALEKVLTAKRDLNRLSPWFIYIHVPLHESVSPGFTSFVINILNLPDCLHGFNLEGLKRWLKFKINLLAHN